MVLTMLESHLKSPRSSSPIASSYVTVGGDCWILEPHRIFLEAKDETYVRTSEAWLLTRSKTLSWRSVDHMNSAAAMTRDIGIYVGLKMKALYTDD